nr:hypothetical protein [Fodinicola acaciae]
MAALAATDLGSQDTALDPAQLGFDAAGIPSTVGEAVTKYLETLPHRQQAAARALLTAIAYARGDGINDQRWITFATALGYPTSQLQIDEFRATQASGYLLHTSTMCNGRVTRLFHQALVDELLDLRPHRRSDERAVLTTLLPSTPFGWGDSDAYVRTHVSDHAHAAGQLSPLLNDEHYLAVADLSRLLPLLPAHPDERDATVAAVLRRAAHRATDLSAARRAGLLALTATHLGRPALRDRFNAIDSSGYRITWAHTLGAAHQQLAGQISLAVAAVGRLGGRDIIVSASIDYAVRMWDAAGQPIGPPIDRPHQFGGRCGGRALGQTGCHRLRQPRHDSADLGCRRPASRRSVDRPQPLGDGGGPWAPR